MLSRLQFWDRRLDCFGTWRWRGYLHYGRLNYGINYYVSSYSLVLEAIWAGSMHYLNGPISQKVTLQPEQKLLLPLWLPDSCCGALLGKLLPLFLTLSPESSTSMAQVMTWDRECPWLMVSVIPLPVVFTVPCHGQLPASGLNGASPGRFCRICVNLDYLCLLWYWLLYWSRG